MNDTARRLRAQKAYSTDPTYLERMAREEEIRGVDLTNDATAEPLVSGPALQIHTRFGRSQKPDTTNTRTTSERRTLPFLMIVTMLLVLAGSFSAPASTSSSTLWTTKQIGQIF